MFNVGLIGSKLAPPPVGEVTLTDSSGVWTAPPGVTSVCAVLVGKGGDGVDYPSNNSGGGGGALAYKNNVAVVPGTSYSYTVGAPTSIFGITAGAGAPGLSGTYSSQPGGTASGGDANFSGGAGKQGFGGIQYGGGAATYTASGAFGSSGATGIGLYGIGSTGSYGKGGNSSYSGGRTYGGAGAIRLIWGSGRSFPSNAA